MVMATVKKEEMFPELFCEECLKDDTIKCKRNKDVKCLMCGAELCGFHMVKHLKKKHFVSLLWRGIGALSLLDRDGLIKEIQRRIDLLENSKLSNQNDPLVKGKLRAYKNVLIVIKYRVPEE